MKRKNTARNALFTSILSLLLCVSMLVGTTFAWFTDEVVTGMNTIAAGFPSFNQAYFLTALMAPSMASVPLFVKNTRLNPEASTTFFAASAIGSE